MTAAAPQLASQWIASNLRCAMSPYGQWQDGAKVVEIRGAAVIDSGIDYSAFNAVILSSPVQDGMEELDQRVNAAERYCRATRRPWSCWVCDELLDARSRVQCTEVMHRYKLRWIADHEGMLAEGIAPAPDPGIPLRILRVASGREREDFAHACAQAFGLPWGTAREVYGSERFWLTGLHGWVGYWYGLPVATAVTMVAAGSVGLYSVGTISSYQRRGIGEAMTRYALAEAESDSKAGRAVLQSTRSGSGIYRRIGFRTVCRFSVYMSR